MRALFKAGMALALCLLYGLVAAGFAQEFKIDVNALVSETQKTEQGKGQFALVWWIPEEFWQVSISQEVGATPDRVEELLKVVRPYTMVAAVGRKVGAFSHVLYMTKADIFGSIKLIDSKNNAYRPYKEEEMSAELIDFI